MKPYISLGIYRPTRWRAREIGLHLTDLTARHGLRPHEDAAHGPLPLRGRNWVSWALHAEVRRRTFRTQQAEGWHYDGDLTEGSKPDCILVLWASNTPTQVKWNVQGPATHYTGTHPCNDIIYQPRPYEVVAFRNLECLHRRPPGCPHVRWVFRQRCDGVLPRESL